MVRKETPTPTSAISTSPPRGIGTASPSNYVDATAEPGLLVEALNWTLRIGEIQRRKWKRQLQIYRQELNRMKNALARDRSNWKAMQDWSRLTKEEIKKYIHEDLCEYRDRLLDNIDDMRGKYAKLAEQISQEKTNRMIVARQIKMLENENQGYQTTVSNLEARRQNLKTSDKVDMAVWTAIRRYQDEINTADRAIAENFRIIDAYKAVLKDYVETSDQSAVLRAELRGVSHEYTAQHQELAKECEMLKQQLREYKRKHGKRGVDWQSVLRMNPTQPSDQVNDDNAREVDSWEKLYNEKARSYKKLEDKYRALRSLAIQNQEPERKNENMKGQLTALQDKYNLVAAERDQYKAKASSWETEFNDMKEQFDSHCEASEQKIVDLEAEMFTYIQEYHDRLPANDPDWWRPVALQKQIRGLKIQLEDRTERQNIAEKDRDVVIAEFMKLRQVMEEAGELRYVSPYQDPEARKVHMPRYQTETEVRERKKRVDAFINEQKRRRKNESAEERRWRYR